MIKLYNALEKRVTEFKPEDKIVKMYSCGPTVYSYAHIGNMRAYLFMDLLRRVLKYNNYNIDGVMNITDVGHLVNDADEGDDKMAVASKRENKSPWEIADFYTEFFYSQAKKLNIDLPEHIIKATQVIPEMISFVEKLIENGYAYETSKGVYFDVLKYSDYGKLSESKIEDKKAGARIEVDSEKRNPADFTLWVKAPKEHIMQWESPWGMGYPGWHIECSAIGRKFLGENIDIHTGGVDHVPVHHENEIAQNYGLTGKQVVKRWMHVEFLQVDGGKMSKSLGNIYTINDLEEKGYSAQCFRYFTLNAHYSKQQNFTFEALDASKVSLNRLYELVYSNYNVKTNIPAEKIEKYETDFLTAINDDLNIPLALSVLWIMLKEEQKSENLYNLALKFDKVLGLNIKDYKPSNLEIPDGVKELAKQRWEAKQNKNYALADEIRNNIQELGYSVKDNSIGYDIVKN